MREADPRVALIERRISEIKRILIVSSGKGGVGKSTVSVFVSLILKDVGFRTGLFDLDIFGPSTHYMLGVKDFNFTEEMGVEPLNLGGLSYMSIVPFTDNNPLSMRGGEITDVFLELFTIINWGSLDFLVVDMPPGLGDITLDMIRFIDKGEYILVSNSSLVSMETVSKLISLLKYYNLNILGLIENMKLSGGDSLLKRCEELKINYLGDVKFYPDLDKIFGNLSLMKSSAIYKDIERIFKGIV